ncbi:MAG: MarR family winged helix-turn-helix transcriptional regulator [Myxococcota bacterium]
MSEATIQDAAQSIADMKERNFPLLVQLLTRDFTRRCTAKLEERGHPQLQASHNAVFQGLGAQGTRLTDLARRAAMTKQAMGQIVDDLERLGYVERVPDPADGRAKIVRFTVKGRAFMADAAAVIHEIWDDYANLVGQKELAQAQQALRSLWQGILKTAKAEG